MSGFIIPTIESPLMADYIVISRASERINTTDDEFQQKLTEAFEDKISVDTYLQESLKADSTRGSGFGFDLSNIIPALEVVVLSIEIARLTGIDDELKDLLKRYDTEKTVEIDVDVVQSDIGNWFGTQVWNSLSPSTQQSLTAAINHLESNPSKAIRSCRGAIDTAMANWCDEKFGMAVNSPNDVDIHKLGTELAKDDIWSLVREFEVIYRQYETAVEDTKQVDNIDSVITLASTREVLKFLYK